MRRLGAVLLLLAVAGPDRPIAPAAMAKPVDTTFQPVVVVVPTTLTVTAGTPRVPPAFAPVTVAVPQTLTVTGNGVRVPPPFNPVTVVVPTTLTVTGK